jgi:hypothetical protein
MSKTQKTLYLYCRNLYVKQMKTSKKVLDNEAIVIRQKLIEAAAKGEKLFYTDLAIVGDDRHMNKLSDVLSKISRYEWKNSRPLLSSIIVNKGDDKDKALPGARFFMLCADLRTKDTLEGLQSACFAFWKNEENLQKYKQI